MLLVLYVYKIFIKNILIAGHYILPPSITFSVSIELGKCGLTIKQSITMGKSSSVALSHRPRFFLVSFEHSSFIMIKHNFLSDMTISLYLLKHMYSFSQWFEHGANMPGFIAVFHIMSKNSGIPERQSINSIVNQKMCHWQSNNAMQ